VVDDGSTDRTVEIARRHRVTVLSQRNIGPSEARNAAIRHTTQPWGALLDADDVREPDKLARQWEAVQACPEAGAIFSDFIEFDETGLIGTPYRPVCEDALGEGDAGDRPSIPPVRWSDTLRSRRGGSSTPDASPKSAATWSSPVDSTSTRGGSAAGSPRSARLS
jgi:glycosyltransferase involved in cell wall biosynthesis